MDIRFVDHPSFHRAALGMTAGAAVLGSTLHVATHDLSTAAPLIGGLFGIAIGAAWGYGKAAWRLVAAIAASVPLLAMTPSWPALALCAAMIALGCAAGAKGIRGALIVMLGATVTLLAMWTALRFDHSRAMRTWPAWTTDGLSAAAMGIVGVVAMLPRHIGFVSDPIKAAWSKLPADLDAEVRDLCGRSVTIWNDVSSKLAETDPGLNLVRDGVLTTIDVAAKSADVKANGTSDEELGRRMEELDKRIAAATDDEVKHQYTSARAALTDQRRYRDHIRQNRERLVARMHNHVAALEKFQLAAGGLAAARAASSGANAVQQLQELSQDVAASGEALAEIEIGSSTQTEPVTQN